MGAPNGGEGVEAQQFLVEPDAGTLQYALWNAPEPEGWRRVLRREGKRTHFWSETSGWNFPQPVSPTHLALDLVDEERFPGGFWLKQHLAYVAGRADEAVVEALLGRWRELGLREITFEIDRRGSDSTVVKRGADRARARARAFQYILCLWDHRGSGEENKPPSRVQGEVQNQLNRNSLKGCSKALVIDPELETWLWQDQAAIAAVLEVEEEKLTEWLNHWHRARVPNETLETLVQRYPKEALEQICRRAGEKPTAALYARIASLANLDLCRRESSFRQIKHNLYQPTLTPGGRT